MKKVLQVAFLALVLTALAQALWQHGRLPEKVAIHFNGSGRADAWGPRRALTALHLGTVLFLAALIQGLAWVQDRLPKEFIHLPHRDHWLAPARAAATRDWLTGSALVVGCALMLFFIALFQLIYQANLTGAPRLSTGVWWLAGGLLAVVGGVLVCLLLRFGRKPVA